MPTITHRHFQRLLICVVSLVMIVLLAACAGVSNPAGTNPAGTTSLTGTVVSVNAAQHSAVLTVSGQQVTVNGLTDQQVAALQTQVGKVYTFQVTGSGTSYTIVPNSTPQPGETQTSGSNATQSPTTFAPGSIQFTGTVRSISSTSTMVSMPNGKVLSMNIVNGQTDLGENGALPTVGQLVKVKAVVNTSNGSFTATSLKVANSGDMQDQNVVEYQGVTTSAVGSDGVIHFKVGNDNYSYTINASTTRVKDFANAQAIGANQPVKVKVQFNGSTAVVLEVQNATS